MKNLLSSLFAVLIMVFNATSLEAKTHYSEYSMKELITLSKQGDASAMAQLGLKYDQKKNSAEAKKWLTKAANKGHVKTQYLLALMYMSGNKIYNNKKLATIWLMNAAKKNHTKAQCLLGEWYAQGEGVLKKNEKEAIKWFKKSAKKNYDQAQYLLGLYYMKSSRKETQIKGVKLLIKSSMQHNKDALEVLKSLYTTKELKILGVL